MRNNTQEEWRKCDANCFFEVSNHGRLRSIRHGCVLSPSHSSNGYAFIKWRVNNKWHTELLHRAVAKAFIPNPLSLATVNHINGNKCDNSVQNLEWASVSDNIRHAFSSGLNPRGERHGMAKLTESAVADIRLMSGSVSQSRMAAIFGVSQASVYRVLRDITWRHVA